MSGKDEVLRRFAAKYIWWKSPDEALRRPRRVVAQVMNLGDFDDARELAGVLGDDALREAIRDAEAGEFTARSWTYWHYRLGLAEPEKVPPLPARKIA